MQLTKAQEQILNMGRIAGGASANIGGRILFKKHYSAECMEQALNKVFSFNDAFSLRLKSSGGHYEWYILPYQPIHFEILRFATIEALDSYGELLTKQPFDLRGPLFDFKIVFVDSMIGIVGKVHHIIGDAWSAALLGRQLSALLAGDDVPFYSYQNYIIKQNQYLQSARHQRDKVFFEQQLQEITDETSLINHYPASFRSARKTLLIEKSFAEDIYNYAAAHDAYPYAVLMTAVAVCMNRLHNNTERFFLGMTMLNRSSVQENNTFGLFIDTVPVLIRLNNDKTFLENMSSVIDCTFSTIRHSRYTYSEVQQDNSHIGRLFDVVFNYQTAKLDGSETANHWYSNDYQLESLLINVNDYSDEGIFRICYDYQTELFTERQIELLHGYIIQVLHGALHNDVAISAMPILSKDELELLTQWNQTDSKDSFSQHGSICAQITHHAEENPQKIAVYTHDQVLTYGDLDKTANRIANALLAHGIDKGSMVAIMLPRNRLLLPAMLGVLKAGAAYVPIDPNYPPERIKYILNDCSAAYFITAENINLLLQFGNSSSPNVDITPNMTCYCIYTSGSTGKPKGVLISHENISNYVMPNKNGVIFRSIQPNQVIVSTTTVSFDIFVTESLLPLSNGMSIVLADEDQACSQDRLNTLLAQHHADVLQITPSKMRLLSENPQKNGYLRHLKCIIIGGEPADPALIARLRKFTDAKIHNYYGPTETTVWASSADVSDGDITIGAPLANTQVYILDRYENLLPIGVQGELCIAGKGVGVGYLNRPDLTAEKFTNNPFGEGKLYHTGDLAYLRKDGNIVFVGRNDFQVKIHGQRVELGEIEAALSAIQGIRQAAVITLQDDYKQQIIRAFYTGEKKSTESLISGLSDLPSHMLPNRFIHLDEFPLTPSGKVDRKALENMIPTEGASDIAYIPPKTAEEKVLIAAICAVLHHDKASMLDNFLRMGGDSIGAIELIAILDEQGYTLPAKAFFSCQNMQELAKAIVPKCTCEPSQPAGSKLPATEAQLRIYTAQKLSDDPNSYHISFSFPADDNELDRLQNTIQAITNRHESLRTYFETTDGILYQVVDPVVSICIEPLSAEGLDSFVRPFDLSKAPLWRVGYCNGEVYFDFHHLIFDGGSLPVFLREISALYSGQPLPIPPVQYRAFRQPNSAELIHDKEYWHTVYTAVPEKLIFSGGLNPPGNDTTIGSGIYYNQVDASLHGKILQCCSQLNITPFTFYFGAYSILLSIYGRNQDFNVGIPSAGRDTQFLNTIGMFVNTVTLRCKITHDTVEKYLREIAAMSVEAFSHQKYPYGTLLRDLGKGISEELFSTLFVYHNELPIQFSLGGKMRPLRPMQIQSAQYDLALHLVPDGSDILLAVIYRKHCLSIDSVQHMTDSYHVILHQMIDLSKKVDVVSALTEQDLILHHSLNQTTTALEEKSIFSYFENQVQQAPEQICLIGENGSITFRQFSQKVAHLDWLIRSVTHGTKQPIAVLADRSPEMYLALYSIVRGGNAYLPIDPVLPPERIRFMLQDSNAQLVLAQDHYAYLTDGLPVLSLTNTWNALIDEGELLPSSALPEDIAYILYTSGSSGAPKGVLIRNNSVVNRILWMQKKYPLSQGSVILAKTPYTFDVSVWEIFWWGMCGGRLAYMAPQEHFLPSCIVRDIQNYQVTHLHFVPSVFRLLLDYLEAEPTRHEQLQSIRHVFLSGETLHASLVQRFHLLCPQAQVHNLYGPTECTVDVSFYDCVGNEEDPIPIGKPIDNTQLYILDQYGNSLPIGVQGELCIAGKGVGAGYLNRPELTTEKFTNNPFGEGKLYHTGDLAYLREDGNIVFVGRDDFQVKIHGQRVELGEIEAILLQASAIQQVCVLSREHLGQALLIAFYSGAETDPQLLWAHCAKSLASYMIPSRFIYLDELPLTSSGKVNRKALENMPLPAENVAKIIEPINIEEQMICDVFRELLHLTEVGRNTDFLVAGGTSLDVITFLTYNKQFSHLTAADFLQNPTPVGIAAHLQKNKAVVHSEHNLNLLRQGCGKELLVLLPFAGGNAESYTSLITELIKGKPGLSIAFLPYPHSEDICCAAAKEISAYAAQKEIFFYAHCVGNAPALQIIRILENDYSVKAKMLFAGAFIPPAKHGKNAWAHIPDSILRRVLKKAGSRLEELPSETANCFLKDFRRDTSYAAIVLHPPEERCHIPVCVLISPQDLFTPHTKQAAQRWGRYTDGKISIETIQSPSHYFQSTHAPAVASWIIGGMNSQ